MGRAHEVRKVAMAKTAAAKAKLYSRYGKEIYLAAKAVITAGCPGQHDSV